MMGKEFRNKIGMRKRLEKQRWDRQVGKRKEEMTGWKSKAKWNRGERKLE